VKFPAICLADSLKKSTVAEATRHQCAVIKAHVDSANRQLAIARTVKITGPKAPHKPTTHPPPTPHLPADSSVSPVDTLTPVVAPVLAGLEIVTQPGDAASGATLTPQPVVRFVDQFHATYPSTATVTAALGAGVATITGTTTISATSGVAAFSTVGATTATTGSNTLTFSTPGYPAVTSSAFTVTAPPPPPPPPPVPAPTIASFTASPSNLSSAGNVTLTWATTGATSLSLAPGIGNVSGTSRTLTVSATTTFTLTATNSSGSATANATVTLVPPGGLPATPGIAELRARSSTRTYPTPTRSYKIAAGSNLQTAIDTAKRGDEIRLPLGATWTGNYTLRKKAGTGWIILRADTTDAALGVSGTRMTPSRAPRSRCRRSRPRRTMVEAIGTADSAHFYRLVGLDVTASPAVTLGGALVRLGGAGSEGQRCSPRCPAIWSSTGVTSTRPRRSTSAGALQCTRPRRRLSIRGSPSATRSSPIRRRSAATTAPARTTSGTTTSRRPAKSSCGAAPIPCRRSSPRPTSRSSITTSRGPTPGSSRGSAPYAAGQWQVKNLYESKNGCRQLLQGNVFESNWSDAQTGFSLLFKSENQDGTAPYTQTCDVTIRFNLIQNVGNGFNLAGKQGPNPSLAASRITIHDNYMTGINTGIYTAHGYPLQILTGVTTR
jgi:hypothetical protein